MAARFWVGGTGNWDAADTTHWAATSGGAGGQTVPGASDTVTFDSNSGGGTVTVTATQSVTSIALGTFVGIFLGNGQTITCGIFNASGSAVRTVNITNCSINCTGAGAAWTMTTVTNLTFVSTGSTITLTTGAAGVFAGGGLTYDTVILAGPGQTAINGTNTFTTLTRTGTAVKTDGLQLANNQVVSGTLTLNSNSAINRLLLSSSIIGTARTITAAVLVCTNVVDFKDITGAGAATWTTAASGATYFGDCGGNSGITFTPSATQTWAGTVGGNWSANAWTSRVPLPQDDVIIASAFSASQTVSADMPRLGRAITWTGSTGNPAWGMGTSSVFGSVTLIAAMTISGTSILTLEGRGSYTLTSAGVVWTNTLLFQTGTWTLGDALSISRNNSGCFEIKTPVVFVDAGKAVAITGASGSATFTSGTATLTGTWTISTTAVLTFFSVQTAVVMTATAATIILATASANNRFFGGGGKSYGTFTYTVAGSTGMLTVTGSNTFANFNFSDATNVRTLRLTSATTTTISTLNGFNVDGTAGLLMTIDTTSAGSAATLTSTLNQIVTYASIKDSAATGGGIWQASLSTSVSGNSGWYFAEAVLFDAETGSGAEAETSAAALDSPDTGAGLDAEGAPAVALDDGDTGIGAEAEAYLASLVDAESGSGLDAESQGFGFFEGDFGVGTESESLATAMADADTGLGTDGETIHQQAVRRIRASGREPTTVGSGREQSS